MLAFSIFQSKLQDKLLKFEWHQHILLLETKTIATAPIII